jgi:hypothetical protein
MRLWRKNAIARYQRRQTVSELAVSGKEVSQREGILVDTFFEGMHLTFKEIFFIFVLAINQMFRSFNFHTFGASKWRVSSLSNSKCAAKMKRH